MFLQDSSDHRTESMLNVDFICPFCKADNRKVSKFCRNCGKKICENIPEERKRESLPSAAPTIKVKDAVLFFSELRENYYGMGIDGLKSVLNYQQYLFETSEKGLALIEENTGRFIALNSKFEEITNHSAKQLKKEIFTSLISNLNPQNKQYDMKNILPLSEFVVFNREYEKISVKINKNSKLFANHAILVTIDNIVSEQKPLKKDRSATKKLFLVSKIVEEINKSLDINIILNNTLERLMSATESDAALIMFMEENKMLKPRVSKGLSENFIEDLKKHTVSADIGTRAKALSSGKTVEARMEESPSSLTGTLILQEKLEYIVTVPLKFKEDVIGVISLGRRHQRKYSGKDFELLDSIGNHVVIAIKNSRLYEQIKVQLQELEEKNDKLRELEKIKENLIRMVVHDLKSPLTGIMGYAEYLQMSDKIKDAKLLRIFQSIYISSQDLLRMVMNLLNISKMEEGKLKLNPSSVNPREIIDKTLDDMRIKLTKKKLTIIKTLPETLPNIKADKDLFYRIIMNLLDNAIKYSDANGEIEIGIIHKPNDSNVLFYIADDGEGIPQEFHKKIFEAFFTLQTEEKVISTSTGIGLSFCKMAVDAHGGRIWMEDNIPLGSKFFFTLPVS